MTQQLKQDKVEFYVNALETMGYSHPNDIPGKWWSGRSGQAEKEEACRLVYTTLPDRRKKKPSTVADNQTTGQVKDDLKAMLIEFKRESDDKFNKLAEMMQTGKAPGISTSEKQAKAEKQLVPTDTLEIKTVTVKQTKCSFDPIRSQRRWSSCAKGFTSSHLRKRGTSACDDGRGIEAAKTAYSVDCMIDPSRPHTDKREDIILPLFLSLYLINHQPPTTNRKSSLTHNDTLSTVKYPPSIIRLY